MPKTINIQIQLEPDLELDEVTLVNIKHKLIDFALEIEPLGYLRYEMYLDQVIFIPKGDS